MELETIRLVLSDNDGWLPVYHRGELIGQLEASLNHVQASAYVMMCLEDVHTDPSTIALPISSHTLEIADEVLHDRSGDMEIVDRLVELCVPPNIELRRAVGTFRTRVEWPVLNVRTSDREILFDQANFEPV